MEKTKLLTNLIHECKTLLDDLSYTEESIKIFSRIWDSKLRPFMESLKVEYYSCAIGEAFLDSLPQEKVIASSSLRRSITLLDTTLTTGRIGRYYSKKQEIDFSGEIGSVFSKLLEYKRNQRVAEKTVYIYERTLCRLMTFLRSKSITKMEDVSDAILLEFVNSSQVNPSQRYRVVSGLCKFLADEKIKPPYFGQLISGYRLPVKEKLPSVYSAEEIAAIVNAINRKEYGGKRLYALFLMGALLGLRKSDIVNLRFSNIDWENNIIVLNQMKTKKRVELPLLADVGKALIDYLKNERNNKCNDDHVFLTLKAPYQGISGDTLHVSLQAAIHKSGINIKRRHHGIHAMRHSLATALLSKEEPLPVIKDVLGHASTNSTKSYLRVDLEGLKKCLLSVPPVPISFYEQKGGVFYE